MASLSQTQDDHEKQRQQLLAELLSDVKGCQVRFGGRSELAIEQDPRVACLCSSIEAALSYGLKQREPSRGLAAIKQVRNIVSSGLNLHLTLPGSEPEKPVLWWYVRELLTRHEYERFLHLKNVSTDFGRGRAWIRSLLNEHSLERYMHILTSDSEMLCAWYEPWSLLRDQERAAMLPNLAAGLDSILFAINIDNCELGDDGGISPGDGASSPPEAVVKTDPEPAYAHAPVNNATVTDVSTTRKKRELKKRKKKIPSQLVSFDEEELPRDGGDLPSALNSPLYHSAPTTCLSSPAPNTGGHATPMADKLHKLVCQRELEQAKEALKKQKTPEAQKLDNSVVCDIDSKKGDSAGLKVSLEDNTPYQQLLEKVLPTSPTEKNNTNKFGEGSQSWLIPGSGKDEGSPEFDASSYKSNLSLDSYQSSECDTVIIYPHLSEDFRGMMTIKSSGKTTTGETKISDDDRSSYCAEDLSGSMSSGSGGSRGDATAMSPIYPSDTGGATSTPISSSLSVEELRNAVLQISRARDTAEEKRKEVEAALAQEMEASSTLRAEAALTSNKNSEVMDKSNTRINGLTRENELLKHQLKKYIGAVQLLRRENGSEGDTSIIPQPKPHPDYRDYHEEAEAYEGKLIQVAEMHGELMEFNERLQRHLRIRDSQVHRLREELIDLRGPLPDGAEDDVFDSDDNTSITSDLDTMSLSTASRTLVHIWIPTAFLSGTSQDVHHVYQIYLRIRDDEWNVYRRYAQFYELHQMLRKRDSVYKTFDFPQKKTFGYKDTGVVQERRGRLQKYLRQVVNHIVTSNPQLGASPDKQTLTDLLPFLIDAQQSSSDATPSSRPPRRLLPRFSSGRLNQSSGSNTPQYNGL